MAKLSRDLSSGTLHPRENITGSGALGALNAEIVINADGASTIALDLRGTFSLTVEVAGSVDGTNWTLLAVRSISGGSYLTAVAGTAAGAWVAACAGFAKIRARVTAYTSGAATATLLAATGLLDDRLLGEVSSSAATITAVVSTAATLILTAPGLACVITLLACVSSGMRQRYWWQAPRRSSSRRPTCPARWRFPSRWRRRHKAASMRK